MKLVPACVWGGGEKSKGTFFSPCFFLIIFDLNVRDERENNKGIYSLLSLYESNNKTCISFRPSNIYIYVEQLVKIFLVPITLHILFRR